MPVTRDKTAGPATTGHEWDGITELNNPVPRVARWAFLLALAFAAVWQLYYPSWPGLTDFYPGLLNHSTRVEVTREVAAAHAARRVRDARIIYGSLALLAEDDDPALRRRVESGAAVLVRENCAMCHGRGLDGQSGFPDLTDGAWLWSPAVEDIADILRHGINSGHDEGRVAEMPAFGGADGILEEADIQAVADRVLLLAGRARDGASAREEARGAAVFAENCAVCHGDDGAGGLENGAPDLTGGDWIYGGDREAILHSIRRGRLGVMPAWSGRLTEADIRKLALFLHWNARDAR